MNNSKEETFSESVAGFDFLIVCTISSISMITDKKVQHGFML